MERLNADELLAYLDGSCTPASAQAVEEELARNPQARVTLLQLQAIRSGLTPALLPAADPLFLRDALIHATEPRRRLTGLTWGLLAVLTLILGVLAALQISDRNDRLQAQLHSGLPALTPEELSTDVHVRDLVGRSRALVDGGGLQEGDSLSVTVTNHSSRSVFVLVLALDAEDGVQWLYPAEDQAPARLAAGSAPRLLVNVALKDVAPGPLQVITWFSETPRSAQDADLLLQAGGLDSLRHAPGSLGAQVVRAEVPEGGPADDDSEAQ